MILGVLCRGVVVGTTVYTEVGFSVCLSVEIGKPEP